MSQTWFELAYMYYLIEYLKNEVDIIYFSFLQIMELMWKRQRVFSRSHAM